MEYSRACQLILSSRNKNWTARGTHADTKERLKAILALASIGLVAPLGVVTAYRDTLVSRGLEAFVALAL